MQQEQYDSKQNMLRDNRVAKLREWRAVDFAGWHYQRSNPSQNAKVAAASAFCLVELAEGLAGIGVMLTEYDAGVHSTAATQTGYVLKHLGALMASIASNTCEGIEKSVAGADCH